MNMKIQASSDNYGEKSFLKKRKKKTNILVMCNGVLVFCRYMYVYPIKVRVYCHKIDCPLQWQKAVS